MTEVIQKPKKAPRFDFYPKSSRHKNPRIDMNPKSFKKQFQKADYFAIGDSFVNMFLHAQNAFFMKLKGKSLKGLAKCDKQERKYIERWVDSMPSHCEVIFNFGQVDLNFVRYYKLVHDQIYEDKTFQDYVQWISSLSRKSIVLGILASPIKQKDIFQVLTKYGTLNGVFVDWNMIRREHLKTEQRRKRWNELIEKACEKHGVKFVNVFDYNKQLGAKFLDQNPLTVHLRYLPTLMQVQKKLTRIVINIQKSLQIEQEYVTEKTQRYYKNLQVIMERKKLLSIEEQQTKTENNSSKDGTEEEEDRESDSLETKDQSKDRDQQDQQGQQQDETSSDDEEVQQSKVQVVETLTVEDLLYKMSVKSNPIDFCTVQFQKSLARLANDSQNLAVDAVLSKFTFLIVEQGTKFYNCYVNEQNEARQIMSILKNLTVILEDVGKERFIKSFLRSLQQLFEKSLSNQTKKPIGRVNLHVVIKFIIGLFNQQAKFSFPVMKQKLMQLIIRELFQSLFGYLLQEKIDLERIDSFNQSINLIKNNLTSFLDKNLQAKLQKLKITEDQVCSRFKLVLNRNLVDSHNEKQQKKADFQALLFSKYSFAVCSKKFLSLMITEIQKKLFLMNSKQKISPIKKSLRKKEHDSTFKRKIQHLNQQFNQKRKQIEEKQSQASKTILPSSKCCRCGCMIGLLQNLKSDKHKGHKGKEKKQQA